MSGTSNMYRITNVVVKCLLNVTGSLNLTHVTNQLSNAVYEPRKFSAVRWQHRRIGGSVLLFNNGYIVAHGSTSYSQARRRVRQYARVLQRLGYNITMSRVELVTMSLVSDLGHPVSLADAARVIPGATYEPELLNACMIKTAHAHYNLFSSGKVVITGVRKLSHLRRDVLDTLMDLMVI